MSTLVKTDNDIVIEEEKMIAKFMDVQVYETWQEMDAVSMEKLGIWCLTKQLEYSKIWNKLMTVVEKIEGLHDASYLCRIVSRRCIIYDCNIADQASVYQGKGEGIIAAYVNQESKLIATYKAVLEFILWYNSQKQ